MRLELDQNASTVAQVERSALVGSNGSTKTHFDEVLSNGITAAQTGHRAQARILLQYAVELDPKSEAAWLWLASISEYPEELLVFLDRVLEINSKNSRALEWKTATKQLLAKTFVQRGIDAANEERNAEAVSCFDTALSYDAQNQLAWFWKDSLTKQPESDAVESLNVEPVVQQLVTLEPPPHVESTVSPSKLDQAEDALAGSDRHLALKLVDEAIDENSECEKAWALRSHLVDDFEEKRLSLERVVTINPENSTARAALETLVAMVETVAPDKPMQSAAATEVYVQSPFDSLAETIAPVDDHSPTGELKLPESILQHNPFVAQETYEVSADVWARGTVVELNTDEPNIEEDLVSADDYPTIEVPFSEYAESLHFAGSEQPEDLPIEPPSNFVLESNSVSYVEATPEPSAPEVQEVSTSAYLEEPFLPQYESNDEYEPAPQSWQDETIETTSVTNGHADTWVVEDSDTYIVEDAPANSAQTILVVDDSAVVRKLIAGKLEESGYNVISAGTGVEALAVISTSRPDLVLLDIAMPKMDGYQVCEKIRGNESTRDIPVVMISGKDGYFDEERGQKAGTSSFISKPFGPETLMKALDTYLPSQAAH